MDLSNVPFDVPIILQSVRKGSNLQNPVGSNLARCLVDNRDLYEQLTLRRVQGDKISLKAAHNGRCLQVLASGECIFVAKEPGHSELFTIETDSTGCLYLVSCHTGKVLQCDDNNVVKCANHNRRGFEAWRILEPRVGVTNRQEQVAPDKTHALVGRERQDFVLVLVKYGKSADEIEQIVTRLFDAPAAATLSSTSAYAVPVDKA
ncbi:hypothetical protein PRNP1_009921 [Phytophthora ramorum]